MMISKINDQARIQIYALLAHLYRTEVDKSRLEQLKQLTFPTGTGALTDGYALLRDYLDHCDENAVEELSVDFAKTFLAAGSAEGAAALPCESIYTSSGRLFLQDAWEVVCRRYQEKGLGKAPAHSDLHEDHLSLELEFMGYLLQHGSIAEQSDFLHSHLLNWIPAFASDVERYAQTAFYRAVARITLAFLELENAYLSDLRSGALRMAPSYSVRADRMADIFARLKQKYRIFAPRRFPAPDPYGADLVRYGEINAITEVAYKENVRFPVKEAFDSNAQSLFQPNGEADLEKDILLFLRPCDINAIQRLDASSLHLGQAELKLILLECRERFQNCSCVSAGSNVASDYSAAVRIDDICALVEICDEALLPYFSDEVPIHFTPQFVCEN